jgi:hypothetical protein
MDLNLTQYKDVLGEPNKGFHEKRIPFIDIALLDTIGTFAIAVLIYCFGYGTVIFNFIILFAIGQLLHYIFGVRTAFMKYLGF